MGRNRLWWYSPKKDNSGRDHLPRMHNWLLFMISILMPTKQLPVNSVRLP